MNKNILALSVAAAALASSASAAVSSNIVGYVKIVLHPGQNLIANPLNNTADKGNNISTLLKGATGIVAEWKADGSGFTYTEVDGTAGVVDGVDHALPPGLGFFFDSSDGTDTTITAVGDALVGTQTVDCALPNSFVASKIPIEGTATDLGLAPTDGSFVLKWNREKATYDIYDVAVNGQGQVIWPGELGQPSFTVGQGFVVQTDGGTFTWTKTFNVP